jgi:hypothetical protein
MTRSLLFAAVACLFLGSCKPHPKPAPSDTTTATTPPADSMDSVGTDSQLVDQNQGWPGEFPPEPSLTPDDTTLTKQDSAAIQAKKHRRAAPSQAGRDWGFSTIPENKWCQSDANATIKSGDPDYLPNTIKKAAQCGIGMYWTIPRTMMTTNGQQAGPFSLAKSKAAIDKISAVVNPLVGQYGRYMLGQSLLDDWKCKDCWGGNEIPLDQIVELVKYAHDKYNPAIPIGLRGEASFLKGANFEGKLDYNVDQWHKKKGPRSVTDLGTKQLLWYRDQATAAKALGISRQIYAVNVGDMNGGDPGTDIASPADLTLFVGQALLFDPADAPSCGVLNWKYLNEFSSGNYPTTMDALAFKASQQTRRSCRSGEVVR